MKEKPEVQKPEKQTHTPMPIEKAIKENYPHRPTKNGKVHEDSSGLYAANGEFIASFENGNGDNFRMATPSVRTYIVRAVNSHELLIRTLQAIKNDAGAAASVIEMHDGIRKHFEAIEKWAKDAIAQAEGKVKP